MASVVNTIGLTGLEGYPIRVQVKVIEGPTTMNIVGLGDQAVKEAKDRIEAAFNQVECVFPKKKIIVNLSPSDIKKSGTYFDLPMIIGLMLETEQLKPMDFQMCEMAFLGEVGLSGELVHFKGVIPMIIEAKNQGIKRVVLPEESYYEARKIEGVEIYAFRTLNDVIRWLEKRMTYQAPKLIELPSVAIQNRMNYSDVIGQNTVMPYVLAAAAGGHNMLLIGPPGCGKSMIAKRMPTILPDLTEDEATEVLAIHSIIGNSSKNVNGKLRPFRAPHYNISTNAIIGGGIHATPGEISLAHNGVLFLDELPEFTRQTIDALRQPLEDRIVTVARVKQTNTFPANFMLIAAMNPCKCGHYGTVACKCSPNEVNKYRNRISGPILDRMDIQKYLSKVDFMTSTAATSDYSSERMKEVVMRSRNIQTARFKNIPGLRTNGQMDSKLNKEFCQLDSESTSFLDKIYEKNHFSARTHTKIMNLARTFADLDESKNIRIQDITSAVMGRDLEKEDAFSMN